MPSLANIWYLGIKELRVLRADPVLLFLIVYTFTIAVYTVANGVRLEVRNAAIAIVDEDRSELSRSIRAAVLPPLFKPPAELTATEVTPALDAGRYVFVLNIPPRFEADLLSGRPTEVAIDIDATAMSQAGNGAAYIQQIIQTEVQRRIGATDAPIEIVTRVRFNPNLDPTWFTAVMQVVNAITMLSIILPGAAFLREREHGTLEHLVAMPVTPFEIMAAKIIANALTIVTVAVLSLLVVVHTLLQVPIHGSITLFVIAAILFQVSVASLSILLATLTSSTGQFGLLAIPAIMLMMLLSGSMTPLESMPSWLQTVVQVSPATQFVAVAQAVIFRGAGIEIVGLRLLVLAALGGLFLVAALLRFRQAIARAS